jgi:hypothetical protein
MIRARPGARRGQWTWWLRDTDGRAGLPFRPERDASTVDFAVDRGQLIYASEAGVFRVSKQRPRWR